MSVKCPFCKTKIFGEKKPGDKFKCYKCEKRLLMSEEGVLEDVPWNQKIT